MKGSERKTEDMKRNELQRKEVKEKIKEIKGQKKEKQKEMRFSSCPLTSPRPPCLNPLENPKGCFISFQFYLSVGLGSVHLLSICFQVYVCRLARIPRSSKNPGEKLLFITSHGVFHHASSFPVSLLCFFSYFLLPVASEIQENQTKQWKTIKNEREKMKKHNLTERNERT